MCSGRKELIPGGGCEGGEKVLSVRKKVIPLRGFEKNGDIYNRVMGTWIWLRTPGHQPMFE